MTPACSSTTAGTLSEARPRPRRLRCIALELDGGRRIAVPPREPLRVGKGPDIDLELDDRYVSGRHATVRLARDGVVVEDLGSKNGTYVDGVVVDRAWAQLGAVLRFGRVSARVVSGGEPSVGREEFSELAVVGTSPAFRSVVEKLERIARVRSPVLLRGETGTGKEVAARVVHRHSERRARPFVAINCGAIPESLAESELFGHVRGAFTGAHRDRQGAFSRADGGTLLLDEVAELAPLIQAKLLRVLETGRMLPVGAETEQPIDVRVIAATHRDLEAMITTGELREDLYHRLGVLTLKLPPLRERREDIPGLLEHFARRAAAELGYPIEFTEAAITAATRHSWPGNIRALRNAVLRAGAMGEGVIQPQTLVPRPTPPPEAIPPGCMVVPRGDFNAMRHAIIEQVIDEEGSIRRAAKVLGIPRTTLGNWLRRA
ncbi:MAG: sigma 54-interacting transcriptional regulator [Myxococcota bacterium]